MEHKDIERKARELRADYGSLHPREQAHLYRTARAHLLAEEEKKQEPEAKPDAP